MTPAALDRSIATLCTERARVREALSTRMEELSLLHAAQHLAAAIEALQQAREIAARECTR